MKLSHYNLENSIDFDESAVWSLVCESPRQFARLTRDFYAPSENTDGGWFLYDGKRLDLSKYVMCLIDFHNVGINDKKSSNILQEKLKQTAFDEHHTVSTHEIISAITGYLNNLTADVDFPTRVCNVDLGIILKSVGISFLDESENLCEKLMDYVTLLSRLTVIKVIVCVNLRSYLEIELLDAFFNHCEQNCINVLCIESHCKKKLNCEKVLFCDEDMCEFFPNK